MNVPFGTLKSQNTLVLAVGSRRGGVTPIVGFDFQGESLV